MARIKRPAESAPNVKRSIRPALTPEAREQQLTSLAYDLVEQRLLDGTASAQETTYFLKLSSTKTRLEAERQELENELIKAKTEQLQSQKRVEELYANAIRAMREYGGYGSQSYDVDDDEEVDDYDEY